MLALARRRELGTIEHREGIAATDLDIIMPAPIWRTRGADQPHAQYTAVKLQRRFHIIRVDADVIDIHGCSSVAGLPSLNRTWCIRNRDGTHTERARPIVL